MFNSVALDVVIGLLFIYLLYSLLATIIGEIITTFFSFRAKNLYRAIQRMLEDKYNTNKSKADNKDLIIADSFYDQPQIKYLASGKKFKKPSYLKAKTFSRAIIQMLKKDQSGKNDLEKIKDRLKSIVGNTGINYEETETGKMIKAYLEEAEDDLHKFRQLLEEWFDSTMERAMGWYKRKMQIVLLIIGLLIAFFFNASTWHFIEKLSKDKDARQQLVAMATSYIENRNAGSGSSENNDDLAAANVNDKLDSLLLVKNELVADINDANNLLGVGWSLPDNIRMVKRKKKISNPEDQRLVYLGPSNNSQRYAFVPYFLDLKTTKRTLINRKGEPRKDTEIGEDEVILRKWLYWAWYVFKHFPGYLITAIAISLGAPFWFDLLNKFVRLRNSKQEPTSQEKTKNESNRASVSSDDRE